ncbi:caspase family protein [Bradyrhizobium sp. CCBAU 53415]|uniref:caspase family protein n=1 Tax=Bradyrhizobium sp. CCBAU 53415 TaxID=1325119 RepID=UPI002306C207|nr:caspase family protein [Bradyrhizobium sp. CCBAU 53415]
MVMQESRLLVGLAVALVALTTGLAQAAAEARKPVADSAPRLALVIGNSHYTKLGTLANPGRDAELIADSLRQTGFEVTSAADRDLKGLWQDVDEFAQKVKMRGPATVAVLYYAGHGVESDGVNYLVPVNADIRKRADIVPQSLSVKRIADRLSSAGNALNILIIDACRDNPFPPAVALGAAGLVPMGAVYGVFIASATGSGKPALDGEDGHSPYTRALAEAMIVPGERLEDVFKSVRRQVRLATGEQQIPWESTSLELDFFFVPPPPPPSQAAQLLAAAKETGNVALYDLLIDRFPASPEADEARAAAAEQRRGAANSGPGAASLVLDRARRTRTPEAYDLVAALFPDTPEADEAQAAASRLREITVLDSAGPTYEGHELVLLIQAQLARLECLGGEQAGVFDAATIQGLRRASQLSDEHFLWYRPTMAALRALKKVDSQDGCSRRRTLAVPRCLRVNNEDFCQ